MEPEITLEKSPDTIVDLDQEETPVSDPGQLEGLRKSKPTDNEPPPNHPRFKEIYGKMKQYEKQLLEVSESTKYIDAMKQHNADLSNKLAEVLENSHKNTVDILTRQNTPDPVQLLESAIQTLNTKREEYRKAMEHDKADSINDQLIEAKVQLLIEKNKKSEVPVKDVPSKEPTTATEPSDDLEKTYVKTWISKNPWFTDNLTIRKQAIEIDNKLLSSPEWRDKTIIERLREVESQIKNIYSGKTSSSGFPNVESEAGGSSSNLFDNKITLTATEVEIARGFGITPQEYAKQRMTIKGGRK